MHKNQIFYRSYIYIYIPALLVCFSAFYIFTLSYQSESTKRNINKSISRDLAKHEFLKIADFLVTQKDYMNISCLTIKQSATELIPNNKSCRLFLPHMEESLEVPEIKNFKISYRFSLPNSYNVLFLVIFILTNLLFYIVLKLNRDNISNQLKAEKEQILAIKNLTSQVAHDIQSPLAALEVVMEDIKGLPEGSKELTINAIARIQEIANNLSRDAQEKEMAYMLNPGQQICLISHSLRSIVDEKRLEFKVMSELNIELDDKTDFVQFIGMSSIDFTRIVSNIINNSMQALDERGKIQIRLSKTNKSLLLTIKDSGPGFPSSILDQPIQRGNTVNKEGGQGLGLFHAADTVKKNGGDLKIQNDNGASVEVSLPVVSPPKWFVPKINLVQFHGLVIIDDDHSTHLLWDKVLDPLFVDMKVIHAQSPQEIAQQIQSLKEGYLYLIDNDLRFNEKGIDLAVKHKIDNVIIVSSGYEDQELQKLCLKNEIKLIPKFLIQKLDISV